jgi:pimeloyl-ACP methyl ester carboxylesterase
MQTSDEPPAAWFTAALAAPASDESVDVAGARICYRAWGEPGRPGAVLVHGTAAHAHWWDHIGPFLEASGLRVAALSISGHGDSDWRDSYSYDQWAAEVMAVASAAGIAGPPFIIGHSLGGHIAVRAAGRYGDGLAGIVIVDSPLSQGPPPAEASQAGRGPRTARAYASREEIISRFRLLPAQPVLPYIRDHIAAGSVTSRGDGEWGWKYDQTVFAKMAPERPPGFTTGPVSCRAAVFRAERGSLSPELAARLGARLGPAVPVVEIPAGHHVMLDEPFSLVSALRAVLGGWSASQ